VLRFMTERPEDATWLPAEERRWLSATLAAEQADTAGKHVTFLEAAKSGRLWAVSAAYCLIVVAFYGVTFWLPQLLQAAGNLGSATIVLLTAIPYLAAAIGMAIVGSHSDRTGERRWHVALPCLIGAGGFALTVLLPSTTAISLATLSIAAFGIWSTLGPLWTFPTTVLRGRAAAGGIALVNSIGNVGGFVGPYAVGWVRDYTGSFSAGLWLLAGALVIAAIIALSLDESAERVA
jgi:nitrate/nitrite transporter NarK